jgi:hypothetical protein
MAQTADPSLFSPDDFADESLFDEDEPRTRPEAPRPSVVVQRAREVASDPEAEARELVARVAQKAAVVRSVVRIASSVMRSYADQKMAEIALGDAVNALAHVERARRIALAAKEAAKHAATLAAARMVARASEPQE